MHHLSGEVMTPKGETDLCHHMTTTTFTSGPAKLGGKKKNHLCTWPLGGAATDPFRTNQEGGPGRPAGGASVLKLFMSTALRPGSK